MIFLNSFWDFNKSEDMSRKLTLKHRLSTDQNRRTWKSKLSRLAHTHCSSSCWPLSDPPHHLFVSAQNSHRNPSHEK